MTVSQMVILVAALVGSPILNELYRTWRSRTKTASHTDTLIGHLQAEIQRLGEEVRRLQEQDEDRRETLRKADDRLWKLYEALRNADVDMTGL